MTSEGYRSYGLQPTVYAKYQMQAATDLHFEGVAPFTSSFMQKLARTVSHFVLDGDPKRTGKPMAVDVGGTIKQDIPNQVKTNDGTIIKADLNWLKSKGFNRWSNDQYAQWPLTELSAFENNSKIKTASESIYKKVESKPDEPYWIFIPTGALLRLANR